VEQSLQHIISACRRKEDSAMRAIYDRYVDRLYYVVKRYVKEDYHVENLLQDIFLKVFNNIDSFDPEKGKFNTWVTTIAIRASLNHLRKNNVNLMPLEDVTTWASADVDPLLTQLELEDLMSRVNAIPDKYRVIFTLYEIDGYDHNEIAEMLGIGASTSRSYLTRAKKMLQEEILSHNDNTIRR
jgi:RNA polymerase sigma-70 factor (ECF subfamily)